MPGILGRLLQGAKFYFCVTRKRCSLQRCRRVVNTPKNATQTSKGGGGDSRRSLLPQSPQTALGSLMSAVISVKQRRGRTMVARKGRRPPKTDNMRKPSEADESIRTLQLQLRFCNWSKSQPAQLQSSGCVKVRHSSC